MEGSQNYTFFKQIFAVKSLPTIYVIDQGEVKGVFEKTDESLTPESFVERVAPLFDQSTESSSGSDPATLRAPVVPEVAAVDETQSETTETPPPQTLTPQPLPTVTPETSTTVPVLHSSTPTSTPPVTGSPVPSLTSRRRPSSSARQSPNPALSHDASTLRYQETLRKQRKQDQEERNRVLRLLEIDREERRRRSQLSKPSPPKDKSVEESTPTSTPSGTPKPVTKRNQQTEECALLIRLFDGAALKHHFKSSQTLADVRIWVDQSRTDGSHPYSFFQPMVRKTYGDGEETQSLFELDLAPSASLVLKPAAGLVYSAYGEGGAVDHPYSMLQRGAKTVAGAVYTFLGIGYTPPPRTPPAMSRSDQRMVRDAAVAAVQMRNSSSSGGNSSASGVNVTENNATATQTASPGSGTTSSIVRSGISSPRPMLSTVSSSVSVNRIFNNVGEGVYGNASASNSSSTLNNIRTIHDTTEENEGEERITYNGNQLSLEDNADDKK